MIESHHLHHLAFDLDIVTMRCIITCWDSINKESERRKREEVCDEVCCMMSMNHHAWFSNPPKFIELVFIRDDFKSLDLVSHGHVQFSHADTKQG